MVSFRSFCFVVSGFSTCPFGDRTLASDGPNLSGRFGYPYGRPGDSFCIRETPGLSGRVGIYANENLSAVFNVFLAALLVKMQGAW